MKLYIQNYLEISTIHGLSYISKRFHAVERIFWSIAIGISAICTSLLIIELIIKVQKVPVVVFMSDELISVSEIPFPAVTVCPHLVPYHYFHTKWIENLRPIVYNPHYFYRYEKHTLKRLFFEKEEFFNEEIVDERKLFNLSHRQIFDTEHFRGGYGSISYVNVIEMLENGTIKAEDLGQKILKRLQIVDFLTNRGTFSRLKFPVPTDDFMDVINEFGKEFHYMVQAVNPHWAIETDIYLSEIITSHGLCFTFNIAQSEDVLLLNKTNQDFHFQLVSLDNNRNDRMDAPKVPRKTGTWSPSGFQQGISSFPSWYGYYIENDFDGFFYYIHDPYELPSSKTELKLHFGKNLMIFIDPLKYTIDDSIADFEPQARNCYMLHEKKLKFFKSYTKNNCETECLSNYMLNRCGCVQFYIIRNATTKVCPASDKTCYESVSNDFKDVKENCGCLERCDYVRYNYEITDSSFTRIKEGASVDSSFIHVKFRQNFFKQTIRKKQFNELDFLSFVGGILGLFAGFSALSFVEVLYWFTVRIAIVSFKFFQSKVHPSEECKGTGFSKSFLVSLFKESSLHGLKFVFGFTRLDSILWIMFILSSLSVCIHMISETREKVPDSRVTVYDDHFQYNEKIPFPAFTLLPQFNKVVYGSKDFDEYSWEIHQFCLGPPFWIPEVDENGINLKVLKYNSLSRWFNEQLVLINGNYRPFFAEIQTISGYGYSFNLIDDDDLFDFEEVSSHFRYTNNITTNANNSLLSQNTLLYPLKFSRHQFAVLTLKLGMPQPPSEICLPPSFLIHSQDYNPIFSQRNEFKTFSYGMTLNIVLTPEIVRTDEDLRKLSPNIRDCYFHGEMTLRFFRKYSQKNCELECFYNITKERCGCVGIDQPFAKYSEVCTGFEGGVQYICGMNITHSLRYDENFSPERNCSCLPMCNTVTYNIKYFAEFEAGGNGNETVLNIRMNMEEIMLYRRYQQFTASDVVSYVGGLLGLFAGISVLSIVEFLYFFTIRIVVDLWRWKERSRNRFRD